MLDTMEDEHLHPLISASSSDPCVQGKKFLSRINSLL